MKKSTDLLQSSLVRIFLLALMTAITISVHYKGMGQSDMVLRGLFRQFCYLPILLAALWFGLRGGLTNAAAITAAVAPMMLFKHMSSSAMAQEALEYTYYFLFGGVFGYLVDRERDAQKKREELVRQVAKMEHLSAIGELAAGLAHEIKNPMGSIKGAAQILEPELRPDHPKREFMKILLEEVDRLNRVVESFLQYARPLDLDKKPIQLTPLIQDVAKQLDLAADDKAFIIELELPDPLYISADQSLIRQVFLNLGLNALEAMHNKGTLIIRAVQAPDSVTIEFQDSGPGVADQEKTRIFMPFHTSKHTGSGLGLTISERIITEHRGSIQVIDAPVAGVIFRVTLPREES